MSENINLISRTKTSKSKKKISQILSYTSIVMLGFVFFLSMFLFLLKILIAPPSLKTDEAKLTSQLNSLSNREAKVVFVKNRLNTISKIIKSRPDLNSYIDLAMKGMNNISVDTLGIGQKDISMNVSSYSLTDLNTFIETLQNTLNDSKVFKKIHLNNITGEQKTGIYVATFNLVYAE